MKETFVNFKRVATGRWALSISTFSLTIPFGVATAFEREINLHSTLAMANHVNIVFAGFFASFLYAFVMQATFVKNRRVKAEPLWKCLFLWFSIGAVQGSVSSLYAWIVYDSAKFNLQLILVPTVYTGLALALLAYYFGSIELRRIQDSALKGLDSLLEVDQLEMRANATLQQAEISTLLREILEPQIRKLRDSLLLESDHSSTRIQNLARACNKLLDLIDAQLSPKLEKKSSASTEVNRGKGANRFPVEFFPRALSVRISMLVITIGTFTGQMPRNGWPGVQAGFLGVLIIGCLLKVLHDLIKKLRPEQKSAGMLFAYPLVFLAQVGWNLLQAPLGFELENPYHPVYSGLKTLYGVYIASVISNLIEMSVADLSSTQELSGGKIREISELEKIESARRKSLFDARFGTLQGKISGMILTLNIFHTERSSEINSLDHDKLVENVSQLLNEVSEEIRVLGTEYAK